ncbi:hypothetical protein EZS27_000568 [termite gut metagenome]|uniref:Uncharacterized protein n=1 Tax=termite gut metagenome TaxID=433724 RepID=A0A5J4SZ86_9ZZZZ
MKANNQKVNEMQIEEGITLGTTLSSGDKLILRTSINTISDDSDTYELVFPNNVIGLLKTRDIRAIHELTKTMLEKITKKIGKTISFDE